MSKKSYLSSLAVQRGSVGMEVARASPCPSQLLTAIPGPSLRTTDPEPAGRKFSLLLPGLVSRGMSSPGLPPPQNPHPACSASPVLLSAQHL